MTVYGLSTVIDGRKLRHAGKSSPKTGSAMTDARDIHIHLTAQPGITIHVTVADDGITVTSDSAEPNVRILDTAASSGDALEAAIQRLESSRASLNVRAAVEGLRALGYELKLAKTNVPGKPPENYLRIIDPKYTAHGVGYLWPTYFGFSSTADRERLLRMPEAEPQAAQVKFSHVESVQPGLNAAKLLKR
jgi:hypothetical protein